VKLQRRLAGWQRVNFGRPALWQLLLGVGEECGELYHAALKASQNIRGMDAERCKEAIADALADIAIYSMQVATAVGIDYEATVASVAEQVMRRDWRQGGDPVIMPTPDWWENVDDEG